MTTGKHQIATNGEEPPASAGATRKSQPNPQRAPLDPWYRRVSFWRAVAGMAVALALGCAAVALEVASELSSSSRTYHRRLDLLGSRVSQMRAHIASIERQLSAVRAENVTRNKMNHILSA